MIAATSSFAGVQVAKAVAAPKASGRSGWLSSLSRTGLVPAAVSDPTVGSALAPRPRTLKPVHPKALAPAAEEAEGGGSPREVEAEL